MDGQRFDDLARALGGARSRRHLLRVLAGGAVAALAGSLRPEPGQAAKCGKEGDPCCSNGCRGGLVCVGGTCCPSERACNGGCCPAGHTCQGGACVRRGEGGGSPGGCATGLSACGGACVDLLTDAANCGTCGVTCAGGQGCVGGTCRGLPGYPCTDGPQCASGFCVDGVCCDVACTGQCETCNGTGACVVVTGTPVNRAACVSDGSSCGGFCDGRTRATCSYPGAGTQCSAPSCADGFETLAAVCNGTGVCPTAQINACVPYVCDAAGVACRDTCTNDDDCVPNAHCDEDATCRPDHGLGQPCDGDGDCESGFCVEGVCCHARCDRPCDTCLDSGVGICTPRAGECDPGDLCIVNARCSTSGQCEGEPKLCSTSHPCRTSDCDSTTGECVEAAANHGGACPGQDDCHDGTCLAGVCEQTPKRNNTLCNVDNKCETWACSSGICTFAGGTSCHVTKPCVTAHCDPATGDCVEEPVADGSPCSDDDLCTTTTCLAGACAVIGERNCISTGPCSTARCDPSTGNCIQEPKTDGTFCGSDRTCCGGVCIDTFSDNSNCGGCGTMCASDNLCEAVACSLGRCLTFPVFKDCPDCQSLVTPCDPAVGPQCQDDCPPPDLCHLPATDCFQHGGCFYPEKTCGPCERCHPLAGGCFSVCEALSPSGECVSTCQSPPSPCHEGFCSIGEGGGTCAYAEICSECETCNPDIGCVPIPQGTACSLHLPGGRECDGAGNCVCKISRGGLADCCPTGTVEYCPSDDACCEIACQFNPITGGTICPL